MGKAKVKGIESVNHKRYWNGKEVKPCKYYSKAEGVNGVMCGSVDGELVRDQNGRAIPYNQI